MRPSASGPARCSVFPFPSPAQPRHVRRQRSRKDRTRLSEAPRAGARGRRRSPIAGAGLVRPAGDRRARAVGDGRVDRADGVVVPGALPGVPPLRLHPRAGAVAVRRRPVRPARHGAGRADPDAGAGGAVASGADARGGFLQAADTRHHPADRDARSQAHVFRAGAAGAAAPAGQAGAGGRRRLVADPALSR